MSQLKPIGLHQTRGDSLGHFNDLILIFELGHLLILNSFFVFKFGNASTHCSVSFVGFFKCCNKTLDLSLVQEVGEILLISELPSFVQRVKDVTDVLWSDTGVTRLACVVESLGQIGFCTDI